MDTAENEALSETDNALLLAAAADGGRRVARAEISCGSVWIKRCERSHPVRHLHSLAAALMPFAAFLRPSPKVDGVQAAEREMRRMKAFREAGFLVPRIVLSNGPILVLSDLGETVFARMKSLRETDPEAHDALLIACARALGEVHAAGLCHGRPHPRDFGLQDGRIGFFDFEEEPQAAMPLASAQARDIWLLFFQIAAHAHGAGTSRQALDEWTAAAPADAQHELLRLVRFVARLLPLARLVGRIHLGGDLDRFIKATSFLAATLGERQRTSEAATDMAGIQAATIMNAADNPAAAAGS